jgi:citrate lyase subunit beta/citryl-CoA lyase
MTARSWLFAPGDSPSKMEKACASGADAVILDLEDSVAEAAKGAAREAVRSFVKAARDGGVEIWVRVNPLLTGLTHDDLHAVAWEGLTGVLLPKAEHVRQVRKIGTQLSRLEAHRGLEPGRIKILPLVTETPRALFALAGYADAGLRLAGLTWGAEDLSAAVGATSPRDEDGQLTSPYLLARSLCLFGAAAAAVPAIETVYPAFRDLEGLAVYARRGRRDGFTGMLAIHPTQVAVINTAFSPTEAEIERARRVVSLFEANPGAGALGLDGEMLDRPHLVQAQQILARARN